jgi:hypothetical protein
MVPKITAAITTANKNTEILALLALMALPKCLDAPKYRANFKTLKILNKRSALKATKACVPINIKDRYFGIVESKSIIP